MPAIFLLIGKLFWLVCVVTTCLNALFWKRHSRKELAAHPELADDYKRLIKGFLIWGNIPWFIMGIGCTFGGLIVFDYFSPREGNPFVLAWYLSVFVLWILGFRWIMFRGGAEQLVRCPGLLNLPNRAWFIKLWFNLCLAGGIVGVVMMFSLNTHLRFEPTSQPTTTSAPATQPTTTSAPAKVTID